MDDEPIDFDEELEEEEKPIPKKAPKVTQRHQNQHQLQLPRANKFPSISRAPLVPAKRSRRFL